MFAMKIDRKLVNVSPNVFYHSNMLMEIQTYKGVCCSQDNNYSSAHFHSLRLIFTRRSLPMPPSQIAQPINDPDAGDGSGSEESDNELDPFENGLLSIHDDRT